MVYKHDLEDYIFLKLCSRNSYYIEIFFSCNSFQRSYRRCFSKNCFSLHDKFYKMLPPYTVKNNLHVLLMNSPVQSHVNEPLDPAVVKHFLLFGFWLEDHVEGETARSGNGVVIQLEIKYPKRYLLNFHPMSIEFEHITG